MVRKHINFPYKDNHIDLKSIHKICLNIKRSIFIEKLIEIYLHECYVPTIIMLLYMSHMLYCISTHYNIIFLHSYTNDKRHKDTKDFDMP